MAIRTGRLGGIDWAAGHRLSGADLNQTVWRACNEPWYRSFSVGSIGQGPLAVFSADGWVGPISRTIDGGSTWTAGGYTTNLTTCVHTSVLGNNGLATGFTGSYSFSVDAGSNWTFNKLPNGSLTNTKGGQFTATGSLVLFGNTGMGSPSINIMYSVAGGSPLLFAKQPLTGVGGNGVETVTALYFKDAASGMAIGLGGSVYTSITGGSTWLFKSTGTPENTLAGSNSLVHFSGNTFVNFGAYISTIDFNTGSIIDVRKATSSFAGFVRLSVGSVYALYNPSVSYLVKTTNTNVFYTKEIFDMNNTSVYNSNLLSISSSGLITSHFDVTATTIKIIDVGND